MATEVFGGCLNKNNYRFVFTRMFTIGYGSGGLNTFSERNVRNTYTLRYIVNRKVFFFFNRI